MALLPQAEGAVVSFLRGGRFFIEQFHQSAPPPEVHSELVEKVAVHERVLVGHWEGETTDQYAWSPGHGAPQPEDSIQQGQKSLERV